jgi:hypothetical protein
VALRAADPANLLDVEDPHRRSVPIGAGRTGYVNECVGVRTLRARRA